MAIVETKTSDFREFVLSAGFGTKQKNNNKEATKTKKKKINNKKELVRNESRKSKCSSC